MSKYFEKSFENGPLIVFVHFGKSESRTLIPYAKFAKYLHSQSQLVLITDEISRWNDFPGKVLEHRNFDLNKYSTGFSTLYQQRKIAKGYWFYTIERIFALKILPNYFNTARPIIHFESDVLSFIDKTMLDILLINTSITSVPRYNDNLGIASILFSKSLDQLIYDLNNLELLLKSQISWLTDMELLGLALQQKILGELPTKFGTAFQIDESQYLLFDGAAIGQYLFGRDAVHNNGRIITGYQNPFSPINYANININCEKYYIELIESSSSKIFRVGNLHIHSKIPFSDWGDFLIHFN